MKSESNALFALAASLPVGNQEGKAEKLIKVAKAEPIPINNEYINRESKGVAESSFVVAASVGQYTGDLPSKNDDNDVQTEEMTTDQAIELAEQR